MKVLITGAGGQLGRALQATVPAGVDPVALDRAALDIGDAAAVMARVRDLAPALVINAAAYTAVDKAESDVAAAHRINAEAPGHLAGAGLVTVGEHVQVGAGGEEFRALAGYHQGVDVVVAVEVLDHLAQADQRIAIPGIGRRMVDGDQRGVAVFLDGQLVGQVEDSGLVGLEGVAHGHLLVGHGHGL